MEISEDELEEIIEEKVRQRMLEEKNRDQVKAEQKDGLSEGSDDISRRSFLKGLAGGAAGLGFLSVAPSVAGLKIESQDALSYYGAGDKEFQVDTKGNITASSIDLGQGAVTDITGTNLSIDSEGSLNAASGGGTDIVDSDTGAIAVKWVEDASGIQPAIDDIANKVIDGDITGGKVKLYPKEYAPSNTIFLKRGVVLEGTREWPQNGGGGNGKEKESQTGTVITTENLPTGPAYDPDYKNTVATHRHFNTVSDYKEFRSKDYSASDSWLIDHSHPHLPLVKNLQQSNLDWGDSISNELDQEWGAGVGIRNLTLEAPSGSRRYWFPENEDDGTQREKHAMYFGVYDGLIIENARKALVNNLRIRGFRGYNGFYQDVRQLISRGNHYGAPGTATDHHGATLQLGHQNADTNRYMRGQWSVQVGGPTPAVKVDNHTHRSLFTPGSSIKNRIRGQDNVFLDQVETGESGYGESAYDSGEAPIVSNRYKHSIIRLADANFVMDSYLVRDASNEGGKTAFIVDDNNVWLWNCRFARVKNGLMGINTGGVRIADSEIHASNVGMEFTGGQAFIKGIRFKDCSTAIKTQTNSNFNGGIRDARFQDVNYVFGTKGNDITSKHVLHDPDFTGASNVFEKPGNWRGGGYIMISNPTGYANQNAGRETQSGDGSTTSFTISHGLQEDPSSGGKINVIPASPDAANYSYVTADSAGITVNYDTAPPDGSGNLSWYWTAKGWSAPGPSM